MAMAMLDINRSISLQTVLARYHREMLLHPSLLTRVESASKISGESTPNDDDHLSSSHRNTQSRRSLLGYRSLRSMLSPAIVGRRKAYKNRTLLAISIVSVIAIIFNLTWISIVLTLIHRLKPLPLSNGLQTITEKWHSPSDSTRLLKPWPVDFSREIIPIPCHSHNDYWRRVPLFSALSAGCTGVEADIWLRKDQNSSADLFVGHRSRSLKPDRTLKSLYLDPLQQILQQQNAVSGREPRNETQSLDGVFDTTPNTTLTLLLDFKSDGTELWPIVNQQLDPLRSSGYFSNWNASTNRVSIRPLTIVATGNAPFDLLNSNSSYRDIFYDAPLNDLASGKYNRTNSYYASISMSKAIGFVWFNKFTSKQLNTIKAQVKSATDLNLKARYWSTPGWPVSWRDHVWSTLVANNVGMLNVDDLISASRWNWNWCVVAGLVLC